MWLQLSSGQLVVTRLVMRLLGGYRVELDGAAVYGFETDKARALLAYLAVEANRPHRRETLANLLWPDRPDAVARGNLRQALARVRRALRDHGPTPFLFVTPADVQFNAASDTTLDVAELVAYAASPEQRRALLPAALCGDFLAGFAVPDSEVFQTWVLGQQEHYHRLLIDILDEQGMAFESLGDFGQAVAAAQLQLRLEPWLEEAYRRAMRGLALAGRRNEALQQYEVCCRALAAELGVGPAAATATLYREIRDGQLEAARPAGPASRDLRADELKEEGKRWFVGRARELGQLSPRLDAALAGETGVVFVSGDRGSGKTTLLEAFASSAMAEHADLLVVGARCSPGGDLDPFAPLRRLAGLLFGDLESDVAWPLHDRNLVDRLRRATPVLSSSLSGHGPGLVDTLVPAGSVARRAGLSSRVEEQPAWRGAPGKGHTSRRSAAASQGVLADQLLSTLAAVSRVQPLLLLFDDLQWVDDATATFLWRVGRELSGSRVLLLGAYRSGTVALGRRDPQSGEVLRHPLAIAINELRRCRGEVVIDLDRADGREFVEAYVDAEPNRLGARFRDALYGQTDGHALFTVETLRNLRARGELVRDEAGRWVAHEPLDWGALPARVEAAIAERIDRLPEREHRILAAASVQGDDFCAEVVAGLTGAAFPEVLALLGGSLARQHHLVQPLGVHRLSDGQRSAYRFTHHLFQKYLYDQLDPVERMQWHGAVAVALERQIRGDPVERERLSPALARHYEVAGLPLQAARALHDAGRQALRLSAYREALSRFEHGLALLADEPSSLERTELAQLLEVARLAPQRNLEGLATPGRQGALARAAEACASAPEVHGQGRPKLTLLLAEAERLWATGCFEAALTVAEQLRMRATEWGEESFVALGHWYSATVYTTTHNLQGAESHLNWVLDWLTPARWPEMRATIGFDLKAAALAFSGMVQWFLGRPERALVHSKQAVAGALERGDAYGQAFATAVGSTVLLLLRSEAATMAEWTRRCFQLSLEHGFGTWRGYAEIGIGRLMVMGGEDVAGIERMRNGIAGWEAEGMVVGVPSFVVILADSCLLAASRRAAAGGSERESLVAYGLAAIDSAFGLAGVPCGQCFEPELHRLRGELLLARDGLAAAEEVLACFDRALQLGQEMGALAWQLRAAMSLVRLRERCDGPRSAAAREGEGGAGGAAELAKARRCLAGVYAQYTEGFALPDLQEAAALSAR